MCPLHFEQFGAVNFGQRIEPHSQNSAHSTRSGTTVPKSTAFHGTKLVAYVSTEIEEVKGPKPWEKWQQARQLEKSAE